MIKKVKRGFTLVEISLFLAITGMLFVGIVAGVQGSIFNQRYNDSVQSFAEFLRSIYSQVMNTENNINSGASGRSEKAIYGKLVTFGEEKNNNEEGAIFSYTVIGDAEVMKDKEGKVTSGNFGSSGGTLAELKRLKVNIVIEKKDASGNVTGYDLAGIAEEYFPRWGVGVQTTAGWNKVEGVKGYQDFKGALLIVRSPRSGTVFTYVLDGETVEVNKTVNSSLTSYPGDIITKYFPDDSEPEKNVFKPAQVDFCIDPEGNTRPGPRRDIRIIAGARNASGVEVIGQDDDSYQTEESGRKVIIGNRCDYEDK